MECTKEDIDLGFLGCDASVISLLDCAIKPCACIETVYLLIFLLICQRCVKLSNGSVISQRSHFDLVFVTRLHLCPSSSICVILLYIIEQLKCVHII